jgi:circadian clock protein KaiC
VTRDGSKNPQLRMVPTGIAGLDTLWRGGLYRGGIYLLLGRPGAGKTILANQICFNHVEKGGRALYVTLLTESHSRMLGHLSQFEFFDDKRVGASLHYFSGYNSLEGEGLEGLLSFLRKLVREHKATFLVIDGLVTAGDVAASQIELKKFIHELQSVTELVGCTGLLLTGADGNVDQYAIRTMVDGLMEIDFGPMGMSIARTLEIVKSRGNAVIMGRHRFAIGNAGISVYPRLESRGAQITPKRAPARLHLSLGIESLDQMIGGGVRPSSVTLLLGASGTGKTLLGLSFLGAGVRSQERGLYLGFSEAPAVLQANTEGLGKALPRQLHSRLIEFAWQPPADDLIPDALAERIIAQVRQNRISRLFIDGIGGLADGFLGQERTGKFFAAFGNELRALGVATVFSEETADLFSPGIELPSSDLAATLDNILFLRHVEFQARLHRLISVMKMRGGSADSSLREFSISERGIELSATFDSAEAVLTGIARARTDPAQLLPVEKKRPRPRLDPRR